MLWKNELEEIRDENAEQISEMSGEMWEQLSPMVEYLSSFSIPMFEEEVLKKDLIGMAKEAEIEQISLEEKLGMPPKAFCDSLVKEGTRKSKRIEIIMEVAVHFIWNLTFFWVLELVMFREPDKVYAAYAGFSFLMALTDVWKPEGRMAWNKKAKLVKPLIWIGIVVIIVYADIRTDLAITGNRFVIGGGLLLASLLAFLLRTNYWNHQSQKYDWK